ncbi:MAG: hypothetical protein AAF533_15765 [Acidobacteriota bacterium]
MSSIPRVDSAEEAGLAELLANATLVAKLQSQCELEPAEVEPALRALMRFLLLVAESDERLTPSLRVDLAWHELILFTRFYHGFCERHFGRFLHHHPGGDEGDNHRRFALTLSRHRERFGTPDPRFWGCDDADCGPCDG